MDTYNAYTHTYAHVYIHSNVYAFLRSLHVFIYSCIHTYNTRKHAYMRIHTHRHKISVPFWFLQNDVPTYTHIYYIPRIFMEIIRFKPQYDHFLVHLLMY